MNRLAALLAALVLAAMPLMGCRTTTGGYDTGTAIDVARQKLESLPEPTFMSLEVYCHDYAAKGIELLVAKYPDTRIPLRLFSDSAISVLEAEQLTMIDVIALSNSLDQVKEGKVKIYLDLAWTLLELNGVIRRNDLTSVLTEREQRLLLAVFKGAYLGTDSSAEERDRILNGFGPRYGPDSK